MDAGNINLGLLQDLKQHQLQQAQLISKLLGLKQGSEFVARVQEVKPISAEARAQLINEVKVQLAQIPPQSQAPAAKLLVATLNAQLELLQTDKLQLAQLNTRGQQLLSYTQQPITPGQLLVIKLDNSQRLVIMAAFAQADIGQELLEQLVAARNANQAAVTQIARLLSGAGVSALTERPASSPSPRPTAGDLPILREALSTLLPTKDSLQQLLPQLPKLISALQPSTEALPKSPISNSLEQALRALAAQIRTPAQVQNPKGLAKAVADSGVFFERKLAQLAQQQTVGSYSAAEAANLKAANAHPGKLESLLRAAKAISGSNANLKANPKVGAETGTVSATQNRHELARQDLKGALLGLAHQLESELTPGTSTPGQPSPLATGSQAVNLAALLGHLAAGKLPELSMKNLRQQLMLLLQQHTQGSLAKIQLQQMQALSHLAEQPDNPQQVNHSWQCEIPLRQGQEFHSLQLHFHHQWVEDPGARDKPSDTEAAPTAKRVRQWQVMINFDIPQMGRFYAQLNLLEENLSLNFWAERPATLARAQDKLSELERQLGQAGINLEQLQFLPGTPVQPKVSLSYALVDIQT